ncbi:uncharacterized protein ACBT44_007685 isoform 1-T1 [Syngnathus typhle]
MFNSDKCCFISWRENSSRKIKGDLPLKFPRKDFAHTLTKGGKTFMNLIDFINSAMTANALWSHVHNPNQTGPNGAQPYQEARGMLRTDHITGPGQTIGETLSKQGRSMKDPHGPRNGLCLLRTQRTDNHISFKDPLRAITGGPSPHKH